MLASLAKKQILYSLRSLEAADRTFAQYNSQETKYIETQNSFF